MKLIRHNITARKTINLISTALVELLLIASKIFIVCYLFSEPESNSDCTLRVQKMSPFSCPRAWQL